MCMDTGITGHVHPLHNGQAKGQLSIGNMTKAINTNIVTNMNEIENSYALILSESQLDFLYNYPQGFNRMKCFATFLKLAVRKPTRYVKGRFEADLTPGQFAISEVELAKLLKCNRKTAGKMAVLFHNAGLVTSVSNAFTTIFTIPCLACWYQGEERIMSGVYSRHRVITPRATIVRKSNRTAIEGDGQEPTAADGNGLDEQASSGSESQQVVSTPCSNGKGIDIHKQAPSNLSLSIYAHACAKDDHAEEGICLSSFGGNAAGEGAPDPGHDALLTHPSGQELQPNPGSGFSEEVSASVPAGEDKLEH